MAPSSLSVESFFYLHHPLECLLFFLVNPRVGAPLPLFGGDLAGPFVAAAPVFKAAVGDLEEFSDLLGGALPTEVGINGALAKFVGEGGGHPLPYSTPKRKRKPL
jgi:hypothetical protein